MTNEEFFGKLKEAGFKVKIKHNRVYKESNNCWVLCPKGGRTTLTFTKLFYGDAYSTVQMTETFVAICSPKDSFNKKTGVRLAVLRAMTARLREYNIAIGDIKFELASMGALY